MRSSNLRLFIAGGLLVALALALLVSPFASSSPDGLNKVAERPGLRRQRARSTLFENGPLAGYAVKGVDDDRLSTGSAGLIGVLVTFGIGLGAVRPRAGHALRRRRTGPSRPGRR